MMKIRKRYIIFLFCLFSFIFPFQGQASIFDGQIFPIEGPKTINLGNQGLIIGNPPYYVDFVQIIKIKPPLPLIYSSGTDISFRGPALDLTYMDSSKVVVEIDVPFSSVYFNIYEPEIEKWEEGGQDEIAIWHYDKIWKKWSICPTRFVELEQDGGRIGRLACFVKGNGIYVLGKMEIYDIYPVDGPRTINLGKQGLFLSNPPTNVSFVKIEKIKPPLPAQFTFDIDIAYRGPALEITFLNANKYIVKPGATLSSVYFNISEPEVKMWEEGGQNEIAIWYYNESSDEWLMCATRFIPERQNNEKYDRLACFVMGNGFYILGKMSFDPVFPLWFKLQGDELKNSNRRIQFD